MSVTPKAAKIGLGGTLILQTGGMALLLAPFAASWWQWGIAIFCNIGGWLVLWTMLYIMARQK